MVSQLASYLTRFCFLLEVKCRLLTHGDMLTFFVLFFLLSSSFWKTMYCLQFLFTIRPMKQRSTVMGNQTVSLAKTIFTFL